MTALEAVPEVLGAPKQDNIVYSDSFNIILHKFLKRVFTFQNLLITIEQHRQWFNDNYKSNVLEKDSEICFLTPMILQQKWTRGGVYWEHSIKGYGLSFSLPKKYGERYTYKLQFINYFNDLSNPNQIWIFQGLSSLISTNLSYSHHSFSLTNFI